MLAETTAQMLTPVCAAPNPSTMLADTGGLYHLTAGGQTSWYGFAAKILENVPRSAIPAPAKLIPIPSSEFPVPAARPRNSCLSNEKIKRAFGLTIPSWEESLALCLREIHGT
jgi:dTDP-4-dehydrorhamnose reductase